MGRQVSPLSTRQAIVGTFGVTEVSLPMDGTAASFWMAVDRAGDGGCPHCNDENNHHHASCDGFGRPDCVCGHQSAYDSAGAPLLTMVMPSAYARPAYLPYAGHAP